jgi:hypothetical protein
MYRKLTACGGIALLLIFVASPAATIEKRPRAAGAPGADATVAIFEKEIIFFNLDDPNEHATETVPAEDNGRVRIKTVKLPDFDDPVMITAHVTVHPIPKDEVTVNDKWDRAGNVRLTREGMPDIEIVKFITAYGGMTEYEVDVTHLAPLLQGTCTFKGFVDTWITPGWKLDFSLTFTPSSEVEVPDLVRGILFAESFDYENMGDTGVTVAVDIPAGMNHIILNYLVTGHCTDGRDADEFVSKDNVIFVDGKEVHRFKPWRDDCLQFRSINPYCRRWSNGKWSSDFSRSGWCPGDKVDPLPIDLSEYLTPGQHEIRFVVENIRPKDENDNYGYWRISSYLLGWKN